MTFNDLGLLAELTSVIAEKGYSKPTTIQEQAIPLILEGNDMMACSQTGTGKTACFVLPILHLLQSRQKGKSGASSPRALILTPTRELAAQIEQSVISYSKRLPLRSAVVYGGTSIFAQIKRLRKGVDVLVATPGRLLDHLEHRTVDLSKVEILVLDEADRMLDMGFIRDIDRILALLPKKRQSLLFSATFSPAIKELADGFMQAPKLVEMGSDDSNPCAEKVSQVIYPVDTKRKKELLAHLITTENWKQVLVFTRTKHGANKLSEQLDMDGIRSTAIHSNKSQAARMKALNDFKRGSVRVLVATDIAARGLDISLLPHVVNFELPEVPADYIHRIGRTGRAGNEGQAASLVSVDEHKLLKDIERLLKCAIPKVIVPGYEIDPAILPQPIRRGGGGFGKKNFPPRKGGFNKRRPAAKKSYSR